MSIIVVDIGNSTTKIALAEGYGEDLEILRKPTEKIGKGLGAILRSMEAEALVYASVVPKAREKFLEACKAAELGFPVYHMCWNVLKEVVPYTVDASALTPGDDRCANVYGLFRSSFRPAVCVDVGTAVTTEILDSKGRFIGGTITPGRELQWRALAAGAAQLGNLKRPQESPDLIGHDSLSSMHSGIERTLMLGTLKLVESVRRDKLKKRCQVMFTGGGAEAYFNEALKYTGSLFCDEAFTLKALAISAIDENCVREYLKNSEL